MPGLVRFWCTANLIFQNLLSALEYYRKSAAIDPLPMTIKDMQFCERHVKEEKRRALWDIEKFAQLRNEAMQSERDGKFRDAISLLRDAQKRLPDNHKDQKVPNN